MSQTSAEQEKNNPKARRNKPKAPKKITPTYLYNSGLYYLQRFAASKNHFRFIMSRKIKTSCAYHKDEKIEEHLKSLDELITQFEEAGLLNDKAFAKGLINSLRRRGLSRQAILNKAKQKGLESELALKTLQDIDQHHDNDREADLKAALILAKKKRLGPFAIPKDHIDPEKQKNRELSAFARAGYSYDIAKKIMEMDKDEALAPIENSSWL